MAKIDRTAITIIYSVNENPNELKFLFVFNNFNLTKNQLLKYKKNFHKATKVLKYFKNYLS